MFLQYPGEWADEEAKNITSKEDNESRLECYDDIWRG